MDKYCILYEPAKGQVPAADRKWAHLQLRDIFEDHRANYVDLAELPTAEGAAERMLYHYPNAGDTLHDGMAEAATRGVQQHLAMMGIGQQSPLLVLFGDDDEGLRIVDHEPIEKPWAGKELLAAARRLCKRSRDIPMSKNVSFSFGSAPNLCSIRERGECYEAFARPELITEDFILSDWSENKSTSAPDKEASPADCAFATEAQQLEDEIRVRVARLRQMGMSEQFLVDLLNIPAPKPSHMVITPDYRIVLTDYHQQEIKMSVLPKVLYFLFLNHPEGLLFKHLCDYRDELMQYYQLLSNRENLEQMRRSIDDLVDCTRNSVNEKCSRIRAAFVQHFSEEVAQPYFVTSGYDRVKRVALDRSLVSTWPQELGWNFEKRPNPALTNIFANNQHSSQL